MHLQKLKLKKFNVKYLVKFLTRKLITNFTKFILIFNHSEVDMVEKNNF